LNSTAFDLGIIDQTVWGYSQGENIFNTIRGVVLLGDHAHPILFFLAPLYWIYSDLNALLILQTLVIAFAAAPLYFIAKKMLKSTAAFFIAAAYLSYPLLHYINLFDFHPAALTILPLMLALYALKEKKHYLFIASAAIAATAKEHYAFLLVTFGIYIAVVQKRKLFGAVTALLGALWFVFNIKVLIPFFAEGYQHLRGFSYLGTGAQEIVVNAVTNPALIISHIFSLSNFTYIILLTTPFAFGILSLLAPEIAFIAAPSLAINLLREAAPFTAILYQHNAELIPFLFVATAVGIKRIGRIANKNTVIALSAFVMLASIGAAISYGPFATIYDKETFTVAEHASSAKELINTIPADASVSASTWAVPHLSHRKEIYMFPNPFYQYSYGQEYWKTVFKGKTTDYVLIDTTRQDPLMNESFQEETTNFILTNENYATIAEKDGWILLKRS
jgi:uncharacterized membrane protein